MSHTPDLIVAMRRWQPRIEVRLRHWTSTIEPASLREPIAHIVHAGGKRVRPLLTVLACAAAGGRGARALDAAVAVELLHTFTLVHDDIMDHAPLRRGRPTVHVRWDTNTAILAGDAIVGVGVRALARLRTGDYHGALERFADAFVTVCEGQALDTEFQGHAVVGVRAYLAMIERKTAALLGMAAAVGASAAGAPMRTVATLERFGRQLGMAFQVHDDYLDIGGNASAVGKALAADIREGKRAFPFVAACARAHAAPDRALLARYARSGGLRRARDIARLLQLYSRLDVPAACAELTRRYTRNAHRALATLPRSHARAALAQLADWLMARPT